MEEFSLGDGYYVGTHHYSYRSGEPARIVGVKTFYSNGKPERVCFHVVYADGKDDWCPVSDIQSYKLLTDKEVKVSYSQNSE